MRSIVRNVTASDIALFGSIVTKLALVEPGDDVHAIIFDDLVRLLESDFVTSYFWNSRKSMYENVVFHGMDPVNLVRYDNWFQFRDPLTSKLRDKKRATHVEQVIERRELFRTEFYNDFLARDGLDHGVNLFVVDNNRHLCDLRIWRSKSQPDFGPREIELLDALEPFLKSALKRGSEPCCGLSPRELEVARLLSRGCTDREIARVLGIGFGTVRTHISRLFMKRECSNRSEFVGLFSKTPR